MKSTRLILCLVAFIYFLPESTYCQGDFGIWYELNGEYSLTKKLDINLSADLRTFNNASKIDQAYLEPGVSYKLNKYLGFASSYRITNFLEDNSEYHIRHKWFEDVKVYYPLKHFSFSARFRLQIQTRTYLKHPEDRTTDYEGRIKLKVQYNIPKFPVNPYLSIESFSQLYENSQQLIGKYRFTAGLEYKIFKKQSVEAEYIYQRIYLPHLSGMNILSLKYNIKF